MKAKFWSLNLFATLCLLASCNNKLNTEPIGAQEAQAAVEKLQANTGVAPTATGIAPVISNEQLRQAWEGLSEREQQAAKLFLIPTTEETAVNKETDSNKLTTQANGCWADIWERYGKNVFGVKVWRYFQRLNVCSNGSYLTSASRERWGETHWIGWKFVGHIDSLIQGGAGSTSYRAVTQGHFEYGTGPWDIQHSYPRIDSTEFR